jgi:hypothetical protein
MHIPTFNLLTAKPRKKVPGQLLTQNPQSPGWSPTELGVPDKQRLANTVQDNPGTDRSPKKVNGELLQVQDFMLSVARRKAAGIYQRIDWRG